MASLPISQCCTYPSRHDGESNGRFVIIEKTHAYISEPTTMKNSSCAVLLLSDGFGISNNAKLLADRFAAQGYLAVLPDLFEGDPFPDPRPATFDLQAWLNAGAGGKGHLPDAIDPIVEGVLRWLRAEKKISRIGAAGYCFGGKYVLRYLRDSFIDVGFVAHPTNSTAAELSAIEGPLSVASAEHDAYFSFEKRIESENLLREKNGAIPWQICLYSGVSHGFAVRANRDVQGERWAMDQAHEQALAWMKQFLGWNESK